MKPIWTNKRNRKWYNQTGTTLIQKKKPNTLTKRCRGESYNLKHYVTFQEKLRKIKCNSNSRTNPSVFVSFCFQMPCAPWLLVVVLLQADILFCPQTAKGMYKNGLHNNLFFTLASIDAEPRHCPLELIPLGSHVHRSERSLKNYPSTSYIRSS